MRRWSEKTEIGAGRFIHWLGVTASKFYDWRQRYGRVNEHNGWVPRDFWLEPWEKEAIVRFHLKNPLEGYRRLTFMMLDHDVVAVSPASVWRVLKQAGLLSRWKAKPSRKGTGFEQPLAPHQHWHVDVSYINLSGTFYYLCSVLDGCSRFLVHWDLRESMKEADIERILERAKEKYPEAKPRIISDNGPQSLAQVAQTGMHPAPDSVDPGRCAPLDSNLRGSLQHAATAQCHRLCDAAGSAGRETGRDPRGSRPQVRRGS